MNMMMNQYEFVAELYKRYPQYINKIADTNGNFSSSETVKSVCEDIGFSGSYLKLHHYDLKTDYNYNVIIEYIEENEEVKNMLLFHEL